MILAFIVVHNLCILLGEISPCNGDINVDPETNKIRPYKIFRELLQMRKCRPTQDNSIEAIKISNFLQDIFASEREKYCYSFSHIAPDYLH